MRADNIGCLFWGGVGTGKSYLAGCIANALESFAAAEGAIGIAEKANKVRQKPLRVILNGLGKDADRVVCLRRFDRFDL